VCICIFTLQELKAQISLKIEVKKIGIQTAFPEGEAGGGGGVGGTTICSWHSVQQHVQQHEDICRLRPSSRANASEMKPSEMK